MNVGDMIYDRATERYGIVINFVWNAYSMAEVFFDDNTLELSELNDLEIINETRITKQTIQKLSKDLLPKGSFYAADSYVLGDIMW